MASKFSHEAVGYENPAKKSDHCALCKHYRGHACAIVVNPISPKAWCEQFSRKNKALYGG